MAEPPTPAPRLPAQELLPLVYDELRRLARARMADEAPGLTLQATSLVHEAYLRIAAEGEPVWKDRRHFFGAAARAMRRILVEEARRRNRLKRGGDRRRIELDEAQLVAGGAGADALAFEEALARLEALDARKGEVVGLRTFAGLSNEETAQVLGVSLATVERDWRFARAWLASELGLGRPDG